MRPDNPKIGAGVGVAGVMRAAVGDYPLHLGSLIVLVGRIAAFGALAAWAYRRDEGRRFS